MRNNNQQRYIDQTLLPDEKIAYWTRPHWIIFSTPVLYLIACLLLLYLGPHYLRIGFSIFGMEAYRLLALLGLIAAIYTGVTSYIAYTTSEYGVTNKRVVIKVGWIRRDTLEVFLDKIEAVSVYQSIPGRLLGYGTIVVIGTGGSQDPYRYVPNPLQFRKVVQRQIDLHEQEQHQR